VPAALDAASAIQAGDSEHVIRTLVAGRAPESPSARGGRPRIVPALALWGGVRLWVVHGCTSRRAVWRRLTQHGVWSYPRVAVRDEAVARRLARAGTTVLEALFVRVCALLHTGLAPWADHHLAAFAPDMVALDETTLDPVARRLPSLRGLPPGDDRLLPGKLGAVCDLRRQVVRTIHYHPNPQQNEQAGARALLADLAPGTLIVADLGYFGLAWFDELTDAGVAWVSRLRARTSSAVLHTFYARYARGDTRDQLLWLGAYRADRAKHAVRLLQLRTAQGRHRYRTNVRAPQPLPLAAVVRLYGRRWEIESAFDLVKTHRKRHLLWASQPLLLLQQLWAVLIIAQILLARRWQVAGRAGVDPLEVSLPLLIEWLPWIARDSGDGEDPLPFLVTRGRAAGYIRPSRRLALSLPTILPTQIRPPPPDLPLVRTPRYARRRGSPHQQASASALG